MKINRLKINKIVLVLVIFLFTQGIAYADATYKINEEIVFGRNYEFEEPVAGTITIDGAYQGIINIGNIEENFYEDNTSVRVNFTPREIGVYKLEISVDTISENGKNLSRSDTVYFIVTEDGKNMSDDEIEKYIKQGEKDKTLIDEYIDRPYLKDIKVKNAKVNEKVARDRLDYTLEVDKNAQEIEFQISTEDAKNSIEGVFSVNPNTQNINLFSVGNDRTNVIYTFRWESPEVEKFTFIDENGEEKELFYYYKPLIEYQDLELVDIKIKDDNYKVLKDNSGSLLIPMKESYAAKKADIYSFSTDGEILNKLTNFINLEGNIYWQENPNKIFKEDLILFNLEEVEIENLNYAKGYKINRTGYEDNYLVYLSRPSTSSAWYQYNDRDKELIRLDLPDNLFEDSLAYLFDVDLDNDYNEFNYSFYDISLIFIAFVSFIVIIIVSYNKKKKN